MNNTLRLLLKIFLCVFLVVILSISIDLNNKTIYAATIIPQENQYLEFKVVSVDNIANKDKQVIVELWAYNLDFKGFDLRLGYDNTKVSLSDIATNEYITQLDYQNDNEIQTFWYENEFGDDLDMWILDYGQNYLRYIFSLNLPLTSGSTHIVSDGTGNKITSDEDGLLIGKFSFRLFNGKIDNNTFYLKTGASSPVTGIKVNYDGTDTYEDQSVFRFTYANSSSNADLSDIQIDEESIEDFDKDTLEYEIEILEEKDNIRIKPTAEDDTATIKVEVKKEDPDNEGQYIYEEIDIDPDEEDYEITLIGLGEETEIKITVTAEDGETTKEYVVTVKQPCGVITGQIDTMNVYGIHIADIKIYKKNEVDWVNLYGHDDLDLITPVSIVQTNNDGTYEVRLIPGEYELLIDKPGYLDYIVINIKVEKDMEIDLGYTVLVAGDINKDGMVEYEDLTIINELYGFMDGDSEYTISADFNNDEMIEYEDLTVVNENYGQTRQIINY